MESVGSDAHDEHDRVGSDARGRCDRVHNDTRDEWDPGYRSPYHRLTRRVVPSPDRDGDLRAPHEPGTMTEEAAVPDGWEVWAAGEDGRLVLTYRPDVFDADAFPAACLPTLYVTHGRRTRRPGRHPTTVDDADWYVTFYLEPEVTVEDGRRFPTREEAVAFATDLAGRFDAGEVAYRDCYQVPRERYLDRLDDLTGRRDA